MLGLLIMTVQEVSLLSIILHYTGLHGVPKTYQGFVTLEDKIEMGHLVSQMTA